MCGVLFYIDYKHGVDLDRFSEALELQNHRGPDQQGIYYSQDGRSLKRKESMHTGRPLMAVGHKRLSIIDTTSGSIQPIINNNRDTFLSYNGEIYNFKDFASRETKHSDTLTLFELLKKNYFKSFEFLNGMWALIFGDLGKGEIFLSKDRYGKKPLYYFHSKEKFIVSSEIKSIFHIINKKREVHLDQVTRFIFNKLSPFPYNETTFYKNIHSVNKGEILLFKIKENKLNKIDQLSFEVDKEKMEALSYDDLKDALEFDIEQAVKRRLYSDVKLGVLLSGGIDSSTIAAISKKYAGESVEYYYCNMLNSTGGESIDGFYAKKLSKDLGVKLHEIQLNESPITHETLLHLTKHAEVPLNFLLSTIPTYLISKCLKNYGVKVALDGVGGDEIMGGYPSYESLMLASASAKNLTHLRGHLTEYINHKNYSFSKILISKLFPKILISLITGKVMDGYDKKLDLYKNFLNPDFETSLIKERDFIKSRNSGYKSLERQEFEINRYQLPFYLQTADTFNMIKGIENRSPFLDKDLHKYVYINEKLKFKDGFNKFMLRSAMPKSIPDYIRWRKDKVGITSTIDIKKLVDAKNVDAILSSKFTRSLLNPNINEHELTRFPDLARSLYSIALLDEAYSLSL